MNIEKLWAKIIEHENESFYTIKGLNFTYNIESNAIRPIRLLEYNSKSVNRLIPKTDFEKVLAMMPISSPCQIKFAQGASYLFGIITDKKIWEGK